MILPFGMNIRLLRSVIICGIGVLSSNLLASAEFWRCSKKDSDQGTLCKVKFFGELEKFRTHDNAVAMGAEQFAQRFWEAMRKNPAIVDEACWIVKKSMFNVPEVSSEEFIAYPSFFFRRIFPLPNVDFSDVIPPLTPEAEESGKKTTEC
jgi:hypothetical protein